MSDEDVFAGLPDKADDSNEVAEFNRWQATALGGLSLSIILTVIGAELHGPIVYTSVLLAAIALPALIAYLMLISDRFVIRTEIPLLPLAIGQPVAVLSLVVLLASYSWAAAILMALIFIGCMTLGMRFWSKRVASRWAKGMGFPSPQYHQTKMDRLIWAIGVTIAELNLQEGDVQFADPQPSDFDGATLRRVAFINADVAPKFHQTLARKLREAAAIPQ